MKRVYKPDLTDNWEWAMPVDSGVNMTIVENFGVALSSTWKPVRMELLKSDEHGRPWKEADMPWLGGHLLILRSRAASVLRDLCLRAGELLPLDCEEAELCAWNVTTIVDALDQEKSQLIRFPSSGRVMTIKRYFFKPEAIEGLVAFRIPEIRTSIFVGEEFVQKVKEAGLTGTQFKEVWPVN